MANGFTPTGEKFTADELKFGYWFVTNKVLLRKIGLFTLMVVDAILIIAVLYGLLNYYVITRPQVHTMNAAITAPALNYQYLFEQSQPVPLDITFTDSLRNVNGSYDFVAEVTNPNETWYVDTITYHFESGEHQTRQQTTYVLPKQTTYFMVLGESDDFPLNRASLVVDDINWQKQANYDKLHDKIFKFEIVDPLFESSQQSGLSGEVPTSRVSFTARNTSAYNFGNVVMYVLLYRANSLIGVNHIPIARFDSGDSLDLSYLIYGSVPAASRVVVVPSVNILNPDSFEAFTGDGEFK